MGEKQTAGKKFPDYPFDTFDGCVAEMSGKPEIDDAQSFCGWLDSGGKQALQDPDAEEVLTELNVEYVSAVDEPAQDSEWLIAKDATDPDGSKHRWQTETRLYVSKSSKDDVSADDDEVKQVAFAPVLVPKEADKQGDVIPKPTIESAAHRYLTEYRKVDSDHDLHEGKGSPVESWTLKSDTAFDIPGKGESRTYPEGTWVMGIKFDDETWGRIQSGELNGLSIYGGAKPVDIDSIIPDTNMSKGNKTGKTSKSTRKVKEESEIPSWFSTAYKRDEDPCWEDYVMVGMKPDPNGSGEVPRCVPEEDADEPDRMGSSDMSVVDAWNEYIDKMNQTDKNEAGGESITKMVDEDALSDMLASVRDMGSANPDMSVEDFVEAALASDAVDEQNVDNLSVLIGDDDGGMGTMPDAEDDTETEEDGMYGDEEEMSLNNGTTQKNADSRVDKLAEAVEDLQGTVSEVKSVVEGTGPRGERMSEPEDNSRTAAIKEAFGLESEEKAQVAREAVVEQVEKKAEEEETEVDYGGITEDEGAEPDATGGHTAAANSRMKTED